MIERSLRISTANRYSQAMQVFYNEMFTDCGTITFYELQERQQKQC